MTNLTVEDPLSQTLNKYQPAELLELIRDLKPVVDSDPSRAQAVLTSNQDLTYAIVQSMLLMGLVNDEVINDVVAPSAAPASAPAPAAAPAPAQPVDKFAGMPQAQVDMIKQFIQLTEEQILALPSAQQTQVRQLKAMYS